MSYKIPQPKDFDKNNPWDSSDLIGLGIVVKDGEHGSIVRAIRLIDNLSDALLRTVSDSKGEEIIRTFISNLDEPDIAKKYALDFFFGSNLCADRIINDTPKKGDVCKLILLGKSTPYFYVCVDFSRREFVVFDVDNNLIGVSCFTEFNSFVVINQKITFEGKS